MVPHYRRERGEGVTPEKRVGVGVKLGKYGKNLYHGGNEESQFPNVTLLVVRPNFCISCIVALNV
eukprot:UN02981